MGFETLNGLTVDTDPPLSDIVLPDEPVPDTDPRAAEPLPVPDETTDPEAEVAP